MWVAQKHRVCHVDHRLVFIWSKHEVNDFHSQLVFDYLMRMQLFALTFRSSLQVVKNKSFCLIRALHALLIFLPLQGRGNRSEARLHLLAWIFDAMSQKRDLTQSFLWGSFTRSKCTDQCDNHSLASLFLFLSNYLLQCAISTPIRDITQILELKHFVLSFLFQGCPNFSSTDFLEMQQPAPFPDLR